MTRPPDHPLRLALTELMHERALPIFSSPVAVRSWVYLVDDADRPAEAAWIDSLDTEGSASAHGRLAAITPDGGHIWERHGEFSTWLSFTTALDADSEANKGLGFCTVRTADFDWLAEAPGAVFRSVVI